MTKGRENAAERMKDVLALVRSRKQDGILSVERYENGLFEEGEIHIQRGQPQQAHVGNLTGEAALHYLSSWRRVYFAFLVPPSSSTTPRTSTASTQQDPPTEIKTSVRASALSEPSVPSTEPLQGSHPTTPLPQKVTMPLPRQEYNGNAAMLIPYKRSNMQDVMALALTRSQRSVYLLVDGRRCVADLARFTSKSVSEVLQTLIELRVRRLIAFQQDE
jgi:hypothetical protein